MIACIGRSGSGVGVRHPPDRSDGDTGTSLKSHDRPRLPRASRSRCSPEPSAVDLGACLRALCGGANVERSWTGLFVERAGAVVVSGRATFAANIAHALQWTKREFRQPFMISC